MYAVRLISLRARALKPPTSYNPPQLRPINMSSASAAQAALASIDLSNYDPEQSRLMDERCILVDEQDRALGAADKKTCES